MMNKVGLVSRKFDVSSCSVLYNRGVSCVLYK